MQPAMIGNVFGRLTAIEEAPSKISPDGSKRKMVRCICLCGNGTIVSKSHLTTGHTKSCGCLDSDTTAQRNYIHGLSKTRIYEIWSGMIKRCTNPNCKAFKNYGGRGIKVCQKWENFEGFYSDIGPGKDGWSIERVDNDGDYEPANVCWGNRKQQARNNRNNKILTVRGITGCMADLCDRFNSNYYRVRARIRLGWTTERAFFEPHNFKG